MAETCEDEDKDEHRVGRVNGYDNIRDKTGTSTEKSHASLAIVNVKRVVQKGRSRVTD